MDTIKQSLAGIVGSVILAGCLSNPNIFEVAPAEQVEAENGRAGETSSARDTQTRDWPVEAPEAELLPPWDAEPLLARSTPVDTLDGQAAAESRANGDRQRLPLSPLTPRSRRHT